MPKLLKITLLICFSLALLKPLPIASTAIAQQGNYYEILRIGRGVPQRLDWSPNGQRVAVASSTGIWLYDNNLNDVSYAESPLNLVLDMRFSPTGEKIAAVNMEGQIYIWEIAQLSEHFRPLTTMQAEFGLFSLTWSPDGNQLATGSWNGDVHIWNTETGELLILIPNLGGNLGGSVTSLAWSPDGSQIAIGVSGGSESYLYLWEVQTEVLSKKITIQAAPIHLGWRIPNQEIIFGFSGYEAFYLWSIANNQITTVEISGTIYKIELSPDKNYLAFGNYEGMIELWDIKSQMALTFIDYGNQRGVTPEITWSSDNTKLVFISPDRRILLWDIEQNEIIKTLYSYGGRLNQVSWSPDGEKLLAVDGYRAKILASENGQILSEIETAHIQSWAWSPQSNALASDSPNSSKHEIIIWDATTGEISRVIQGNVVQDYPAQALASSLAWKPDGTYIATGSLFNLTIWPLNEDEKPIILDDFIEVSFVTWSPDGQKIATIQGERIEIWDTATWRNTLSVGGHRLATWNPDSSQIASPIDAGGGDDLLQIWNSATGETINELSGHEGRILSVSWSPDGTTLISGGTDGIIRVWEANSGNLIASLNGHVGFITSLAWSPDGSKFVSGGDDGTIRIWQHYR